MPALPATSLRGWLLDFVCPCAFLFGLIAIPEWSTLMATVQESFDDRLIMMDSEYLAPPLGATPCLAPPLGATQPSASPLPLSPALLALPSVAMYTLSLFGPVSIEQG